MKRRFLVVHGGGPTPVINASLYGAIEESQRLGVELYGALGGIAGALGGNIKRLDNLSGQSLTLLLQTPASAIGTSRLPLENEDYEKIIATCKEHGIDSILLNGGNGTMDTCGKLYKAAGDADIHVVGIPKTIDNDIAVTDHCPGFGSAARYIAETVAEISQDVRSMPIHVSIVEAMGRNAGWIAGAAALAKKSEACIGPHLIYLPETVFDEADFLRRVETLYKKFGGIVVVVSEGVRDSSGDFVGGVIYESNRSKYYGDVGAKLAESVIKNLGIKARSEKPGISGRASIAHQSVIDREEAVLVGKEAAQTAWNNESGVMIGFKRVSCKPYAVESVKIPIEQVMLTERKMPAEFIAPPGDGVTDEFIRWCLPLIGEPLREHVWF